MKRLVLVDGNALLHRAYHATPPFTTSKGELVNAIFGFSSMLLKVLSDLKPDFLAIAWDEKGPTFRHQAYTQYKATRGPTDEGLSNQYKRVHEIDKAFNIPEFKLSGYEADDLIGTLATQAKNLEIIIVTGDRDIMQLINQNTKVLMPASRRQATASRGGPKKTINDVGLYGEEEFVAKYGFFPKLLVDYKALAGDASDNIPGVNGIGDVSATKLIHQFGEIENIYKPENLKTLPERIQKLLAEGAEEAVMSKKLATLDLKAPIKLDLKACEVADYDKNKVIKLFEELEFKSLVNRLSEEKLDVRSEKLDKEVGNSKLDSQISNIQSQNPASNLQHPTSTIDLDLAVAPVLKKMSKTGILVDLKFLNKMGKELKNRLNKLEQEIYSNIGHEINLNSPKQLQIVLFDELKLPVFRKTKTGRSTDEETLRELEGAHPVMPLLLEYRQLFKLVSTYVDALPKSVGSDGRIHSTFNVEGAATGRISSQNPNLQNIPVRGEMGGEIRKAFIAPQDKVLLAADYSQIELRIMAHLSGDEALKQAFEKNLDIHSATAAKVFQVPIDQVSKQQRAVGKTMNFATLYGQGPHALARQLKIDYELARSYIEEYFSQFPKIKEWMQKTLEFGYEHGYVETLMGRKRYIPELKADNRMIKSAGERAAVNHPVQGCLPWGTKVLTSYGYLPIGELYATKKKPPFVWDGSEWKNYEVLNRGKSQLAQIRFSNGQIFKCDTRHKVLTVDETGYEWKEFSKLRHGIKVCFSMPTIHEFSSKPFQYKHTPKVHNGIPLEITLNKDCWYWLGYYIGDGYLHKRWNRAWVYSLTYFFGDHENKKREQCIKFFTSLDLHPTQRQSTHRPATKLSTRYSVTVYSQGLGRLFEALGLLTGKNAHTKVLPHRIFNETLENRYAFIKGIMDSDGGEGVKEKDSPNIHICQRELLQEIQLLFRTVGVESQIRGPYEYNGKVSYRLDIHRNSLAQALQQGEVSYYNRSLKRMAPRFLVQEIVFLGGHLQKSQFATPSDYVLYSRWKNGGSSSLHHLNVWLKRNNVDLHTPIYHYNEITKIEKLDEFETTFTLSVPGSHRFDSEGVISKNTAADMIKKAMVEIGRELKMDNKQSLRSDDLGQLTMILQVHDELLFECSPKSVEDVGKMVKDKMENALKLSVPVVVDLKLGPNWGEMKELL